jgi:hypothetical protein
MVGIFRASMPKIFAIASTIGVIDMWRVVKLAGPHQTWYRCSDGIRMVGHYIYEWNAQRHCDMLNAQTKGTEK